MKLLLAATAIATTPLFAPLAQGPTPMTLLNLSQSQRNMLGNGSFETWTHGTNAARALGPDLWLAQGTTAGFTTQTAIDFERVPEEPACSLGAPWAVQISSSAPGNFISQKLEDFAGLEDRWVTMTIWVRTDFPVAYPTIAVDDGRSSTSESEPVGPVFGTQRYTPLTVRHQVSKCPTKLEFKVIPDQTVQIARAMVVVGSLAEAVYVPRPPVEPGLMELPLGAVVDWYRFEASTPVPEGFVICDGSTITDTASPFVGRATPDCVDKFVRGVASPAATGASGGADSVDLSHDHTGTTNDDYFPGSGLDYWFIQGSTNSLFGSKFGHRHTFSTNNALGNVSTVPAYVGLLKIIRVR